MIRFIHRPRAIRKTPKIMAQAMGARRTVAWPPETHRLRAHWFEDFFMYYPPLEAVEDLRGSGDQNSQQQYAMARQFLVSCKQDQRIAIGRAGFPIPRTWTEFSDGLGGYGRYVVRPAHHRQGIGFQLIDNPSREAGLWDPATEYLSEFYPKDHEYRVLMVRGEPLITLIKKVPDDLPNTQPWNHANGATFVTVRDINNNRLRHTNFFDLARSSELMKCFDIIGVDIMFHDGDYVVTEFNLCPAITIPDNIERVAEYVAQTPRSGRLV